MITIPFERTDGTYTFRDAIILPDNHKLSEAEIEQIKEDRWNNWIDMIKNPPVMEGIQFDENGMPIMPTEVVDAEVKNG